MDKKNVIDVNLKNYKSLHGAYEKAVKEGKTGDDVIVWDGMEILISYLYYMLEYFEMVAPDVKEYARKNKITRERHRRADKFFAQTHCDRCSKPLDSFRIMSWFNEQILCPECNDREKKVRKAIGESGDNTSYEGCGYVPEIKVEDANGQDTD